MLDFISPYELLCQSKPRQIPTFVTPYDLYSRAGQSYVHPMPPEPAAAPSMPPTSAAFDAPAAGRHTHYISDIHARHSTAGKNVVLSNIPLT